MTADFHIRHLLMEVDIAESSQQIMGANVRMIKADLTSVKFYLEELRSTWQGDSAMEFFTLYDSNFYAVSEFVSRWEEMCDKFGNEIPAWVDMAQNLGGSA